MKTQNVLFALLLFFSSSVFAAIRTDTTVVVNSTSHPLLINTPDGYDAQKNYPLVIGLHYCGGTAEEFLNAVQVLADSLDVIVACPSYFSDRVPNSDTNLFQIVVDTMRTAYSIDTTKVYFTAMSCNSDFGLQQGLKKVYPFRGIFPWAPYTSTSSADLYKYDSDMPTVISVGTKDMNLGTILKIYENLKNNNADVNLILEHNIEHTLNFANFGNMMLKSYAYLNDAGAISINAIEDIEMPNDSTYEIMLNITSSLSEGLTVTTFSSKPTVIPAAEVIAENGNYSFTLAPVTGSGKVVIVVEVADKSGENITQTTFSVNVTKPSTVDIENESVKDAHKIYPNPISDSFLIDNVKEGTTFEIIELSGKSIYKSTVNKMGNTLPAFIKPNTYVLKIISTKRVESHLIVVE